MKKEKKHQKSMNFDKIRFFTITVVVIAFSLIAILNF